METIKPSDLAQKILTLGEQAGAILMKHFNQNIDVDFKKDEYDPVTEADRESDEFIRGKIADLFPDDLILSEENENIPEDYNGRVWMVDPLDETKGFIAGRSSFSINIGLLEDGKPVFGCVVIPARNQYFYAEKGKGAFERVDGKLVRLQVSSVTDIHEARLITRIPTKEVRPMEMFIEKLPIKEQVIGGSVGDKVALIATQKAESHVNTNFKASKWDTCAPQIILEEAGGLMTDMDGNELNYLKPTPNWERSFVMSNNKTIHKEVLRSLEGVI